MGEEPYACLYGGCASVCSHFLCMTCFGRSHSQRGINLCLPCTGTNCSHSTSSWDLYPAVNKRTNRRALPERQRIQRPKSTKSNLDHLLQYFRCQQREYKARSTILSLAMSHPTNPDSTIRLLQN